MRYLSSGIIRGIRSATAEKIVDAFGTDTFNVLENDPNRLATIKGISHEKARKICTDFKAQFSSREMLVGLTNLGMSQNEAIKTYNLFKGDAIDIVSANPYSLIGADTGITFDKAEEIAENLNVKPQFNYRAQAGLCYIIRHNLHNGHTCVPRDRIFTPAVSLL